MPAYPWIIRNRLDKSNTEAKMKTMVKLGVPYSDEEISNIEITPTDVTPLVAFLISLYEDYN